MLRLLGIPSRVAVGFRAARTRTGRWVVTDHDAHAWVEVWFAGHGWVPFDPTTGRATFGGDYSFASDSEEAVAALGRGELDQRAFFDERASGRRGRRRATPRRRRGRRRCSRSSSGAGRSGCACVGLVKAALRRGRYLTRDPRRRATASRKELEAYLRDQGIAVPPGATLDDLRRTVGGGVRRGRAAVRRCRGARTVRAARATQSHAATLARVELALCCGARGASSPLWDRFRGLVSLRSLRRVASL